MDLFVQVMFVNVEVMLVQVNPFVQVMLFQVILFFPSNACLSKTSRPSKVYSSKPVCASNICPNKPVCL